MHINILDLEHLLRSVYAPDGFKFDPYKSEQEEKVPRNTDTVWWKVNYKLRTFMAMVL